MEIERMSGTRRFDAKKRVGVTLIDWCVEKMLALSLLVNWLAMILSAVPPISRLPVTTTC
jgi:hypothetical protein